MQDTQRLGVGKEKIPREVNLQDRNAFKSTSLLLRQSQGTIGLVEQPLPSGLLQL